MVNKSLKYLSIIIFSFGVIFGSSGNGNRGIAFSGGLGVPLFGLNTWYNATPQIGLKGYYDYSDNFTIVYEFHFMKYTHGIIEKRKFTWLVDYEDYSCPDANANMYFNDFIIKLQKRLVKFDSFLAGRRLNAFSSLGVGFYNYSHHVSGLIYPGQFQKPLDQNYYLDPISDRRVAWGANAGIGAITSMTPRLSIETSLEYHIAIGYLRSFEDWGIAEAAPIQFLNIGISLIYWY